MDERGCCLGFVAMALAISILFRHPLKPSVLSNLATAIPVCIELAGIEQVL